MSTSTSSTKSFVSCGSASTPRWQLAPSKRSSLMPGLLGPREDYSHVIRAEGPLFIKIGLETIQCPIVGCVINLRYWVPKTLVFQLFKYQKPTRNWTYTFLTLVRGRFLLRPSSSRKFVFEMKEKKLNLTQSRFLSQSQFFFSPKTFFPIQRNYHSGKLLLPLVMLIWDDFFWKSLV